MTAPRWLWPNNQRGFTLLEILIVLVIATLIFSLAALAINRLDATNRVENMAAQLQEKLHYLQQQAILRSTVYGLYLDNSTCQAYFLQQNPMNSQQQWLPAPKLSCFSQALPQGFRVNVQALSGKPNIIITPDGYINNFVIKLGLQQRWYYQLQAQQNDIVLLKLDNKHG